jgi:hypothetical protein
MARADKAQVARRIDDVLRIRLDGAEFWDVREFVREKEKEAGSAWFLAEGEGPLSDGQIRRYQQRADRLMLASHERSRKKLFRRHLAQRRNLYARAATTGDLRVALACLESEAKLAGLALPDKVALTDPTGKKEYAPLTGAQLDDAIRAELARLAGVGQAEPAGVAPADPDPAPGG